MQNEGCQLSLPGGYRIGYAEYGKPDGVPTLFFHGWPGSRLQGRLLASAADRNLVRLLAVDRPGFGLSDPLPRRTLRDFPALIAAFSDQLGLHRFHLFAVSGGGPYAFACAHALAPRIRGAAVLCCAPPPAALLANPHPPAGFGALRLGYRHFPRALPALFGALALAVNHLPLTVLLRLWARQLPPPDRAVLQDPRKRAIVMASTREAFRAGGKAVSQDANVLVAPWGFALDEISVPMHLVYGSQDTVTPAAICAPAFASVRRLELEICEDEGHYSLPFTRGGEVLARLVSSRSS